MIPLLVGVCLSAAASVGNLPALDGDEAVVAAHSPDGNLALAVSWMTGSFSSAVQAAADTNYFDIRLEMVPVWRDRDDGYWLYVEQAVAGHLEAPYRQRVYHVTLDDDGSVWSDVYTIPRPLRFAGSWRESEPLAALSPDSLALRDGCAVVLKRTGPLVFDGGTIGTGCPSELRGASYATSVVSLTPHMLLSWDRGFDESGNQVWGAESGGYEFLRVKHEDGTPGGERVPSTDETAPSTAPSSGEEAGRP